jgi:hypothetical protein
LSAAQIELQPGLVEHIAFSVVDNPELRVIVQLPLAEANWISKIRKVIGAFQNGAQAAKRRLSPLHGRI